MPAEDGIALITYAMEQNVEDKLYSRWVVWAQNSMSFEDFKRELSPPRFVREDKLMEDVEKIMNGVHHGDI